MSIFMRPEDPSNGPCITKFIAVVGNETAFPGPINRTFGDVKDGLSNTIMFGEIAESDIDWCEPRDLLFGVMDFRINSPQKRKSFGSTYRDCRMLLMDGSVKNFANATQPAAVRAMLTINGGEPVVENNGRWELEAAVKPK